MRHVFLTTARATVMAGVLAFSACSNGGYNANEDYTSNQATPQADIIETGHRLVTVMGCNDCHSPKRMGPHGPEIIADLLLSGHPADAPPMASDSRLIQQGFAIFYPDQTAAAGPWGISFAANLTPDETGIGNWTEDQFRKALTEGKFRGVDGGRTLLPPMPWENYRFLTDEEIHAIFVYLKSLPPVKNVVPAAVGPDKIIAAVPAVGD